MKAVISFNRELDLTELDYNRIQLGCSGEMVVLYCYNGGDEPTATYAYPAYTIKEIMIS